MLKKSKLVGSIGVAVTVIWMAFAIWLAADTNLLEQPIDQIGSFLSGVAAPPAFLWLILAFFQQGEELRLQREELHGTVRELARQSSAMERAETHQKLLNDEKDFVVDLELITSKIADVSEIVAAFGSLRRIDGATIAWNFEPIPPGAGNAAYREFCSHLNAAIGQLNANYGSALERFEATDSIKTGQLRAAYLGLAQWSVEMSERGRRLRWSDFASRSKLTGLNVLVSALGTVFDPESQRDRAA